MSSRGEKSPAIVVVPDGLAAEGRPLRAVARPSFAFRAVLDHVVSNHASRRILLAPANHFGCGVSEQAAAATYLARHRVSDVLAPPTDAAGYVDTRGNAALLRRHLERIDAWPLGPVVLVVTQPHARRAHVCFRKEGYEVLRVEPVPFSAPRGERIVARLWYYRDPRLHALYEWLALARDLVRPPRRGSVSGASAGSDTSNRAPDCSGSRSPPGG